jgi:glycosyltransferase involved in cell wall biosynthesis
MRVLYDISILGRSRRDPRARTGIFRVVERVARGLAASPACELTFAACHDFLAAVEYREASPELRTVPFIDPRSRIAVAWGLARLNASIDGAPAGPRRDLWLRGLRSALYRTANATGLLTAPPETQVPGGVDVFHSPFHPLPRRGSGSNGFRSPARFLTVYDLTPILFPQFFATGEDQIIRGVLGSLEPEDWVLCISESCRADLCEHLRIDPARVFVTPLAADAKQFYLCDDAEAIRRTREKYGIPEGPYLLSLCTLQPRKNIEHLIRCFGDVIRQERLKELHLVLVGIRGWKEESIFEEIGALGALRDRVLVTGYVDDEDLAPLYTGALAFVYPSFYEGFGLPALEAMQCGVPVITSNTSSLPEVVGEAGIMLDPRDADGLCQSIVALYGDASLRSVMSLNSLEQAQKFSWERCTAQTLQAYRTAVQDGG